MTVPFFIASGLALGVSLAAPAMALADATEPPTESAAAALPEIPTRLAQTRESRYDSDNPDDDAVVARSSTLPPDLDDAHGEAPPIDGEPIALTLSPLPEAAVSADAASTAKGTAATATVATGTLANGTAQPRPVVLASGTDVPATNATNAANAASAPSNSLDEPAVTSPLAQELISGFYSRINVLGYGILQDPINSTLNPDNALAVHRYETQLTFRPDFNLNFRQLELGIKPRFEADWSHVQNGVQGGTDLTTATAYINEWIARYRVTDQLLVSYGRENLQWGPSQLLSPSNPFNQNNGKNNPAIEQPGMDYGRVVVIPNASFTGSFIANTGEGRLNDSGDASGPFHKAYAGKFDYTGEKTYASLIVSKRDTTPWRIGYFGGWNISDALLLYSEGSAALSTNPALPHPDYDLLAGATYTLLNGAMITGEYFHHNAGCTQNDIAQCVSPLALDPTNPYPRRDYLLLQYVDTKLVRNVSLTVRLIQDLNDHSTQFLSDVEYDVGQNWLIYFVPSVTFGPSRSEFGSLVRYSLFAGVSFTF